MTLPHERWLAVQNARAFLLDLLDTKATPRIPRLVRQRARAILKHYPSSCDVTKSEQLAEPADILSRQAP